jgi:sugar O-acyltransferase (sialic acid O-acetyltransferase NeuD family)
MKPLRIIGAGGHAKVVVATARAAGFNPIEIADDDSSLWGSELMGCRIVGPSSVALQRSDVLALLAIGDNSARSQLAHAARCEFATIIHPSAVVDASVHVGVGTVVFAGAVIQPDAKLAEHVIINTSASIDHDCALGRVVHVGPGARLAGSVSVGDGAFIGIGAAIIPGRSIGAWARVGAGAAVIHDVEPGTTAAGVPARLVGH